MIGNRFNVWSDPWVPVLEEHGERKLSLRDTYLRAHLLRGLSAELTPLEYDALLRFLPQVGALILRSAEPNQAAVAEGRYPEEAVAAFESSMEPSLFALDGDKPFLQRWDLAQSDLAQAKNLHTLTELFPHEPGPSSAQWAIRLEPRDPTEPAALALLLVVAWFHTKNGNGKDSLGASVTKGSAGTWHVNPMSVFAIDQHCLGRTLMANTPVHWLTQDRSDPVYLTRPKVDPEAMAQPLSMFRCSYAKSMPLLYWQADQPTSFELGPDRSIAVPPLGKDDKESLGNVHNDDHTRLARVDPKKGTLEKFGSFGARLTSTAGLRRWFGEESSSQQAVTNWRRIPRLLAPTSGHWLIGICSEITDGRGTRWWCDWSELPMAVAGGDPEAYASFQALIALVESCRKAAYVGAKQLVGADPAAVDLVQTAVMRSAEPGLAAALDQIDQGQNADLSPIARQVMVAAVNAFEHATEPLLTPITVREICLVRGTFARVARAKFYSTYREVKEKQSAG